MKKMLAAILTAALGMSLLVGCGSSSESADSAAAETTEVSEEEMIAEGYTETGDGYYSVVTWCTNGDYNIYGEFYYPEDFDESQSYPVIIMSHGLAVTHTIYESAEWTSSAASRGYVCYIFDFCGGAESNYSDGDFLEMSTLTEKDDLDSVIDFVKSFEWCDEDNLFLMGQSKGGLVSAMEAADRNDEIAGLILLYPGFGEVDRLHETYPTYEDIPEDTIEFLDRTLGRIYATDIYDLDIMEYISGYTGDVLLIHGINDVTVPYTYSVQALTEAYADSESELVLISGSSAVHAFDKFYEEGRAVAQNAVWQYLETHLTTDEEESE